MEETIVKLPPLPKPTLNYAALSPSQLLKYVTDISPPKTLICPLTLELFNDPVVAPDGHTYERRALLQWINTSTSNSMNGVFVSPLTNVIIPTYNNPTNSSNVGLSTTTTTTNGNYPLTNNGPQIYPNNTLKSLVLDHRRNQGHELTSRCLPKNIKLWADTDKGERVRCLVDVGYADSFLRGCDDDDCGGDDDGDSNDDESLMGSSSGINNTPMYNLITSDLLPPSYIKMLVDIGMDISHLNGKDLKFTCSDACLEIYETLRASKKQTKNSQEICKEWKQLSAYIQSKYEAELLISENMKKKKSRLRELERSRQILLERNQRDTSISIDNPILNNNANNNSIMGMGIGNMEGRGWGFFPSLLSLVITSSIPEAGMSNRFEEDRKKRVLVTILRVFGILCLVGLVLL